MRPQHIWSDADIALLRQLWAEGLSEVAIGKQLNVSKYAVDGKRQRLGLPSRPSPIVPRVAPKAAVVRSVVAGVRTLPMLPSEGGFADA